MSPVPVRALREGVPPQPPRRGSQAGRIFAFLRAHETEAYRAREISRSLHIDQHTVGAALRRLLARGIIMKRGPYWFALSEREATQLIAVLTTTRFANERLGPERREDWANLKRD